MLYIFDLDGTLRKAKSSKPCPNDPDDQEILPNVLEKLGVLKDQGCALVACSNQGGVACGYMTEYKAWRIVDKTNDMLDRLLDDVRLCCYHEKGSKKSRYLDIAKPKPDMLLQILEDFGIADKNFSCFVGNEYTDEQCATNAGICFHWAHNFFGWSPDAVEWSKNGVFFSKIGRDSYVTPTV